jgi:hypothetical protein
MVEGPHCLLCKHQRACVLPQKDSGQVCGWYNAQVARLIAKSKQTTRIKLVGG